MGCGEPRPAAAGRSNELATNDEKGAGVAQSPRRPRLDQGSGAGALLSARLQALPFFHISVHGFGGSQYGNNAAGGVIRKRTPAPWRVKTAERVYRRGSPEGRRHEGGTRAWPTA